MIEIGGRPIISEDGIIPDIETVHEGPDGREDILATSGSIDRLASIRENLLSDDGTGISKSGALPGLLRAALPDATLEELVDMLRGDGVGLGTALLWDAAELVLNPLCAVKDIFDAAVHGVLAGFEAVFRRSG